MNKNEIISQLRWRYATKKFDSDRKIPAETWDTLEEVLRLSPSSTGLQPWKFVVVQSDEMKSKLFQAGMKQAQIPSCSHLVVFSSLKQISEDYLNRYFDFTEETRTLPKDTLKDFKDSLIASFVNGPRKATTQQWTQRQCYIALGFLVFAASMLGIDSCPMEGFEPEKFDEILGLDQLGYGSVAMVTLGYRAVDDKTQLQKKVRFPASDVILRF